MITAIIQARMGSTRLPGKVLREVRGRPLLSFMLERVGRSRKVHQVLVATTTLARDDPIAAFCEREGVNCCRGREDDVLDRFYRCAKKAGADVVVRLTADCPLIDPDVVDQVVSAFENNSVDYEANTAPPPGTYPDGMDVEVFSMRALKRAWTEAKKPSEREHVTFYFWQNPDLFRTHRTDLVENLSGYRLTVDYPQDFEVVSEILSQLYAKSPSFSMHDILEYLDAHPGLRARNSNIQQNAGWATSFERDRESGLG